MTTLKPCGQTKCAYYKTQKMAHMCPICAECGTAQHIINEDCVECWNCANDEGQIRSGQSEGQQKERNEPIEERPMEIER